VIEPRTALFVIWMWNAFWVFMLTYALGQAALNQCGRPRWPIQGRWLLTLMLFVFGVMFADAGRIAYEHRDSGPAIAWGTVGIRLLPTFVAPMVFLRQWSRGLLNDPD